MSKTIIKNKIHSGAVKLASVAKFINESVNKNIKKVKTDDIVKNSDEIFNYDTQGMINLYQRYGYDLTNCFDEDATSFINYSENKGIYNNLQKCEKYAPVFCYDDNPILFNKLMYVLSQYPEYNRKFALHCEKYADYEYYFTYDEEDFEKHNREEKNANWNWVKNCFRKGKNKSQYFHNPWYQIKFLRLCFHDTGFEHDLKNLFFQVDLYRPDQDEMNFEYSGTYRSMNFSELCDTPSMKNWDDMPNDIKGVIIQIVMQGLEKSKMNESFNKNVSRGTIKDVTDKADETILVPRICQLVKDNPHSHFWKVNAGPYNGTNCWEYDIHNPYDYEVNDVKLYYKEENYAKIVRKIVVNELNGNWKFFVDCFGDENAIISSSLTQEQINKLADELEEEMKSTMNESVSNNISKASNDDLTKQADDDTLTLIQKICRLALLDKKLSSFMNSTEDGPYLLQKYFILERLYSYSATTKTYGMFLNKIDGLWRFSLYLYSSRRKEIKCEDMSENILKQILDQLIEEPLKESMNRNVKMANTDKLSQQADDSIIEKIDAQVFRNLLTSSEMDELMEYRDEEGWPAYHQNYLDIDGSDNYVTFTCGVDGLMLVLDFSGGSCEMFYCYYDMNGQMYYINQILHDTTSKDMSSLDPQFGIKLNIDSNLANTRQLLINGSKGIPLIQANKVLQFIQFFATIMDSDFPHCGITRTNYFFDYVNMKEGRIKPHKHLMTRAYLEELPYPDNWYELRDELQENIGEKMGVVAKLKEIHQALLTQFEQWLVNSKENVCRITSSINAINNQKTYYLVTDNTVNESVKTNLSNVRDEDVVKQSDSFLSPTEKICNFTKLNGYGPEKKQLGFLYSYYPKRKIHIDEIYKVYKFPKGKITKLNINANIERIYAYFDKDCVDKALGFYLYLKEGDFGAVTKWGDDDLTPECLEQIFNEMRKSINESVKTNLTKTSVEDLNDRADIEMKDDFKTNIILELTHNGDDIVKKDAGNRTGTYFKIDKFNFNPRKICTLIEPGEDGVFDKNRGCWINDDEKALLFDFFIPDDVRFEDDFQFPYDIVVEVTIYNFVNRHKRSVLFEDLDYMTQYKIYNFFEKHKDYIMRMI